MLRNCNKKERYDQAVRVDFCVKEQGSGAMSRIAIACASHDRFPRIERLSMRSFATCLSRLMPNDDFTDKLLVFNYIIYVAGVERGLGGYIFVNSRSGINKNVDLLKASLCLSDA
jgi:hypothetical protein